MTLYELLGVKPNASDKAIKAAYRSLAQKHHPDKPNGNKELFCAIQNAYEILSNPVRRKDYDDSGSMKPEEQPIRAKALSELATLFTIVINQTDFEKVDIVNAMREILNQKLNEMRNVGVSVGKNIHRNNSIAKRLSNSANDKLLQGMLNANTEQEKARGRSLKNSTLLFKTMLEMLKDYSYQVDPQIVVKTFHTGGAWFNISTTRGTAV